MARLVTPYNNVVKQTAVPAQPSKLYPNPAWELVTFEFEVKQEQPFSFVIYDMQGAPG